MLAPVDAVEAITPRRLVEVVDFGMPVVSPDGTKVAYRIERASIERNTYDTDWYVQELNGESLPLRVADGGVPLRDSAGVSRLSHAIWSPDGRWIFYRALLNGGVDVWRAAVDGSGVEPLTLDAADVQDFALDETGQILKYRVGATREEVMVEEEAEYHRGIRIDESVPIGQGLFRSGNIKGRLATQRLGFWFDRVPLLADVAEHWKAVDLVTGARWDLAPLNAPTPPPAASEFSDRVEEPWQIAHNARTGRTAVLARAGERNGLRVKPHVTLSVLLNGGANRSMECQSDPCVGQPISGIQWRPNSDELLFTVTDDSLAQSIFSWNVETGFVHLVVQSRGLISGGRDRFSACGASPEALACVAAEVDGPPRLERIDLETGRRTILHAPNAALAKAMADVSVNPLRWENSYGHQFTGQFYPAQRIDGGAPPLFVTYYRCPGFVRGGVGDEWPLAALAQQGISALCINAAPMRLDAEERYNLGLSAVESVIDLLASAGKIDPKRVGMGGLSFGTEVTLWTVIHSDLLAAASVSSPGISLSYYLLGSMKGDAFFSGLRELWQAGAPNETPERWKLFSPSLNMDSIRSPILMQLPEQEFVHTLDFAIPLMREQRADTYVFPNEPHQKFQPRHKLAVYERNLDWFRFWLLGVEDLATGKKEQYRYWRMMRGDTVVSKEAR
ncbi:dipeptidyl aminopeptidase [Paenibacillus dendritiformis]|nr:dipeptidyl aminopeptidase [Paenibacillus dendritiformis]